MENLGKRNLVRKVISGARENSIGVVLFHQAVGRILGINVTDMKCLDIVVMKGSATPSELSRLTGLSSGSTTAMIDRLERKGLIERQSHPADRRGTLIVLTKAAKKKLPQLFRPMATAMDTLVSRYSKSQLVTLADFFARISHLWKIERERVQRRAGSEQSESNPRKLST